MVSEIVYLPEANGVDEFAKSLVRSRQDVSDRAAVLSEPVHGSGSDFVLSLTGQHERKHHLITVVLKQNETYLITVVLKKAKRTRNGKLNHLITVVLKQNETYQKRKIKCSITAVIYRV